jgi:cytochrome c nitrite reductase small subunit
LKRVLGLGMAGLFLSALCGVAIGIGGYTFVYAEGASYLSNDPEACVNCHIMRDEFTAWQGSSHHAVAACNDCHTPHDFVGKYWTKAEHGFRHSKGFTFQDFHEPIRMKESSERVVLRNCVRCHEMAVDDITAPWAGHGAREETNDCLRCHAGAGHGPMVSGG